MVAEERMANVFICMLQFGKFLKLYFLLFRSGLQSELMLQTLPNLVKGKAGSREERAFPSLLSWIQSLPHLAQYSLCFTHQRPHPCLLTGEIGGKQPGWVEASFPYACFLSELFDSLSNRSATYRSVRGESCHGAVTPHISGANAAFLTDLQNRC